jgi:hypothetical protein
MSEHRPGRGCPCPSCEKRREASKAYYHRKKNGEAPRRNMGTIVDGKPVPAGKSEPRFVEKKGVSYNVLHWMPPEETAWKCPDCGKEFAKLEEGWVEVS